MGDIRLSTSDAQHAGARLAPEGGVHIDTPSGISAASGETASTAAPRERIDWSQLWYPGPSRSFTEAELARGGGDKPSRTVLLVATINLVSCFTALMPLVPAEVAPWTLLLLLAALFPMYQVAMWLWRRPTRRRLLSASLMAMITFVSLSLLLRWLLPDQHLRRWVATTLGTLAMVCAMAFWIITMFRAHQIAARLRELDERDRAIAMARQLATAQIQPHFLFNSLASLQHWVDSGDDRAAPMLRALTGYLRATLPMFNRDSLALCEELAAVERYLEVMQARLGERLCVAMDVEPAALQQQLPPGLLLTLVENAIEHGVLPSLHGAELRVQARCLTSDKSGRILIEVRDSGAGLPAQPQDGVGLTNSRARLAQAFGDKARLTLLRRPEGGTCAQIELPFQQPEPKA